MDLYTAENHKAVFLVCGIICKIHKIPASVQMFPLGVLKKNVRKHTKKRMKHFEHAREENLKKSFAGNKTTLNLLDRRANILVSDS